MSVTGLTIAQLTTFNNEIIKIQKMIYNAENAATVSAAQDYLGYALAEKKFIRPMLTASEDTYLSGKFTELASNISSRLVAAPEITLLSQIKSGVQFYFDALKSAFVSILEVTGAINLEEYVKKAVEAKSNYRQAKLQIDNLDFRIAYLAGELSNEVDPVAKATKAQALAQAKAQLADSKSKFDSTTASINQLNAALAQAESTLKPKYPQLYGLGGDVDIKWWLWALALINPPLLIVLGLIQTLDVALSACDVLVTKAEAIFGKAADIGKSGEEIVKSAGNIAWAIAKVALIGAGVYVGVKYVYPAIKAKMAAKKATETVKLALAPAPVKK
jgi:hypothetical protein